MIFDAEIMFRDVVFIFHVVHFNSFSDVVIIRVVRFPHSFAIHMEIIIFIFFSFFCE